MPDTVLPYVLHLKGGSNFRDLGGYKTADGRTVRRNAVFRSAHLGGLTDEDRSALGKLGVRTIVDLRGVNEAAETPHLIDGLACRIVGAHIEPGVGDKIRGAVADGSANPHIMMQFLTDHYRDYPRRCAPGFRTLFATLSDGEHRPLVFHCTAGKDRTGIISGILLDLAGVPRADIVHNYAISAHYLEGQPKDSAMNVQMMALIKQHPEIARKMAGMGGTAPENMEMFLDALHAQYGGAAGYLKAVGLSEEEIHALQVRLGQAG